MAEIRWTRVIIAFLIGSVILAALTFWQAKNDPLNNVDIDLFLEGCSYIFKPDGSYEVIKFGDPRCPK